MARRAKPLASRCGKRGKKNIYHAAPPAGRSTGIRCRRMLRRRGPSAPCAGRAARAAGLRAPIGSHSNLQGAARAGVLACGPAAAGPSHRSSATHVSHRRGPVFGRPIEPAKNAVSMGTPGLSPAPGGICHGSRLQPGASGRLPPAPLLGPLPVPPTFESMRWARSAPRLARPDAPHMALRHLTRPHAAAPDPSGAVSVRRAVRRDTGSKLAHSWQHPRTPMPVAGS